MLSSQVSARPCVTVRAPLSPARNVRALAAKGPADKDDVIDKVPLPLSDRQAEEVKDSLTPRAEELDSIYQRGGEDDPTKFWRFDGPLPETVNGRLAMLGFTAAIPVEYITHKTLLQQVFTEQPYIIAAVLTIFFASLVPLTRGSKITDDQVSGPGFGVGKFNFTNELINGRAAMLGLVVMIGYEAITNSPIFPSLLNQV